MIFHELALAFLGFPGALLLFAQEFVRIKASALLLKIVDALLAVFDELLLLVPDFPGPLLLGGSGVHKRLAGFWWGDERFSDHGHDAPTKDNDHKKPCGKQ